MWYFIVKYLCLGEPQVDKHKPEESHAAEQNKRVCAVGCWELEREEHVCVVCGCVGVWMWGWVQSQHSYTCKNTGGQRKIYVWRESTSIIGPSLVLLTTQSSTQTFTLFYLHCRR